MEALRCHCSPAAACLLPKRGGRRSPQAGPDSYWIRRLIGSGLGRVSLDRTPAPLRSVLPPFESAEVVEGDGDSKIQMENKSGTARVKFVLQKPCLFGEQFLLVGDDPIFGLWDPKNAIPLEWSEDHFWTAEIDLPFGKTFGFKFILRDSCGEFHWQPGPDRVLQTWQTANTIVVTEDWENAESQKITEEQFTEPANEEIVSESTVACNLSSESTEEMLSPENKAATELSADSIHTQLHVDISHEDDMVLAPGLTSVPVSEPIAAFEDEVAKGKPAEVDIGHEEDVILVSCPTPVSISEPVAAFQDEAAEGKPADVLFTSEKVEDQFSGEQGEAEVSSENLLAEETTDDSAETSTGVLGNDMQWGRKALRRFLLSLGFETGLNI